MATAVSEIARNAFRYAGGGRVEFAVEGQTPPQILLVRVSDEGPGIANLSSILAGQYRSTTGMGIGIMGTRRLMDAFDIESAPGRAPRSRCGSSCRAPRRWSRRASVAALVDALARERADDPVVGDGAAEPGAAAGAGRAAPPPERAGRAQQRAGGHQPRRGGALRRARREGRPPAAGRRDEVAVPVQHEPRVPHAAELDPGAEPAAARPAGRPADRRAGEADLLHAQGGPGPLRAGQRPARPRQGRGRQGGGAAGRVRRRAPVRRAARHAAPAAGPPIAESRLRGCRRAADRS